MIAEIITEVKSDLDTFSYLIPKKLEGIVARGSIVRIPFGKRKIRGIIRNISNDVIDGKFKLKEIDTVLEYTLPLKYLEIIKWIKEYYLCSLSEAMTIFLPPDMKRPRANTLKAEKKAEDSANISLSEQQQLIFDYLDSEISSTEAKKPALIFGVTGSGKTEIYIKLIERALLLNKKVVVLVPEIMLTPQTVERLEKFFADKITLMHSNLSASEKYNCYFDFKSGKKPIIIGPRSALLVPDENIGLIIIDEEHEDSYKQEQNPRYHAFDLAKIIAEKTKAMLVLCSATPRVETYYKAEQGEYSLHLLDKRFQGEMPVGKIIDLKNELRAKNYSVLSNDLRKALTEILESDKQALLFLNRRGMSTFVSCRDCGHIILCKDCSIPLVHHLNSTDEKLVCHHCDYKQVIPTSCPNCSSIRIKYFGTGIEKVEREVRESFPTARVARVDASTIKSKNDYEKFYKKFKNHEVDFVIGTQMIAKGFDIPNVDLVGIISADTGLNLPHFKAAERSFQILTQVSGRSGRREKTGKTIIQTYWPEAIPILASSTHDYISFYRNEISERKKFGYPPFQKIVRIISENASMEVAFEKLDNLSKDLRSAQINFIGPGICFYERLHNKYRYQIIIKSDRIPDKRIIKVLENHSHLVFDVDPVNLL